MPTSEKAERVRQLHTRNGRREQDKEWEEGGACGGGAAMLAVVVVSHVHSVHMYIAWFKELQQPQRIRVWSVECGVWSVECGVC